MLKIDNITLSQPVGISAYIFTITDNVSYSDGYISSFSDISEQSYFHLWGVKESKDLSSFEVLVPDRDVFCSILEAGDVSVRTTVHYSDGTDRSWGYKTYKVSENNGLLRYDIINTDNEVTLNEKYTTGQFTGKYKPLLIGCFYNFYVTNQTPSSRYNNFSAINTTLNDEATLEYIVTEYGDVSAYISPVRVFDRGVSVSFTATVKGFTLSNNPDGKITFSPRLSTNWNFVSAPPVSGNNEYQQYENLSTAVCLMAGYEIDYKTSVSNEVIQYIHSNLGEKITFTDAMNQITKPTGTAYFLQETSLLPGDVTNTVIIFDPITQTSYDYTTQVCDSVQYKSYTDELGGRPDSIKYGENPAVLSQSEIVPPGGVNEFLRTEELEEFKGMNIAVSNSKSGEMNFQTAWERVPGDNFWQTKYNEIYSTSRKFYEIRFARGEALQAEISESVKLLNNQECEADRNLLVVGKKYHGDLTITLILWG